MKITPQQLQRILGRFYTLNAYKGTDLARRLGTSGNTLWARIHRYGLDAATARAMARVFDEWATEFRAMARQLRRRAGRGEAAAIERPQRQPQRPRPATPRSAPW